MVAFFNCVVAVGVLCLFLTVPWVRLQFMMVTFSDHTYLLFYINTHQAN